MFTLSVQTRVIIGIIITTAIGVSTGAVHLTHAIPDAWIPAVVAWAGIFAFVGSAAQTALQASGLSIASKTQAAQTLPAPVLIDLASHTDEVKQIVTTPEIAAAAGPTGDGAKVVSKAA